jgi:hypothetical protein
MSNRLLHRGAGIGCRSMTANLAPLAAGRSGDL